MARDSWFAATSTLKEEMLAENRSINWLPPEVGEKRFGEWLENNVDWALSRDRYWGTPLPAWVCESDPAHVDWIGSLGELRERAGELAEDFDPHRPFIDEITWACHACGGTMRRTPAVVDVWFDSGAMPFAQWHYPYENEGEFERHFPADFICEALDQTRGWFYSLLAISTMLGRGTSYRNCMVNGLILDEEGLKMSKSRGNVVDPWDAVTDHGADALRWYMVTVSQPGASKRYDPDGLREATRKYFDTLFNTYRFFALYASAEGWTPTASDPPVEDRPLIDRWILSRLHSLVHAAGQELDAYHVTRAYRSVGEFLNEDLSNWYVRRTRPRFWGNTDPSDGRAAFRTLWECLTTVTRLVAPVTPFTADWLHRALTGQSVHLAAFPLAELAELDRELETGMHAVRALVSLGRAARETVQIRVRQPLRKMSAVVPAGVSLDENLLALLREELNVKNVALFDSSDRLVALVAKPDYRTLGPRFQKRTEEAAQAIRELPPEALAAYRAGEPVTVEVGGESFALEPGELQVTEEGREGLVVQSDGEYTAALDPTLDEALKREGLARELVNRIQRLRKDSGLQITDRISLGVFGPEEVLSSAEAFREFIAGETLATEYQVGEPGDGGRLDPTDGAFSEVREVDLDGTTAHIAITRIEG
jgi:isoleucyl-tRNA synthetase